MASVQIRTEAPEGSIASAYNWTKAIEPSGYVIISKYKKIIKDLLKLNDKQYEENKGNINSILKRYIFLKKSVNNYEYKYNDLLLKIKKKIMKEILISPKLTSLHLFFDLNKYLSFISQNIIKYKSKEFNKDNIIDPSNNYRKIYEYHKKNITTKFDDAIKNIKNILYEISTEQMDATKKFKTQIDELYEFVESIFSSYIKKMKRENELIIQRTNIHIDNINLIEDENIVNNEDFRLYSLLGLEGSGLILGIIWGVSVFASGGISALIFGSLLTISFSFVGLEFISLPIFFIIKGISKVYNVYKRNNKIEVQLVEIENVLMKYKNNILDKMESLLKAFTESREELILSQKNPMINIVKNENRFITIKNDFISCIKKLNK